MRAWLDRVLERDASTRTAALLRIGLAVLVFCRFGDAMMLDRSLDRLGFCILFVFWVSTTAMLFGAFSQLASVLTAATLIASVVRYGIGMHRDAFLPHHHVYLIIAAVVGIALTPCGRSYSIARWWALERADARGEPWPEERGRVGALTLLAIQLSAVYFWGAFNKSTLGWLSGDKFESQLLAFIFDSDPPNVPGWHALMAGSSIATTLFEYTLAFGLWFRRARRWLIPAGIVFHIIIYVTLPVTIFSALSCLLYLAYLDPDEVHRAIDRLSRPRQL